MSGYTQLAADTDIMDAPGGLSAPTPDIQGIQRSHCNSVFEDPEL